MNKNMGTADRAIRTLIAVAVGVLYFTNVISGTVAIILGIIAVIFLLTSFVGSCPAYLPFKISTRKGAGDTGPV
jgi:K+-transporting ATPase A subunit